MGEWPEPKKCYEWPSVDTPTSSNSEVESLLEDYKADNSLLTIYNDRLEVYDFPKQESALEQTSTGEVGDVATPSTTTAPSLEFSPEILKVICKFGIIFSLSPTITTFFVSVEEAMVTSPVASGSTTSASATAVSTFASSFLEVMQSLSFDGIISAVIFTISWILVEVLFD